MSEMVTVTLRDDRLAEFTWRGRHLASYRLPASSTPVDQSPRPYLHPVHTLSGDLVTDFSPTDHLWHHGISWAIPDINGVNFWGGPSFDPASRRYVLGQNHGRQRHERWDCAEGALHQELAWISPEEEVFLHEARTIRGSVGSDASWTLTFTSRFINQTELDLSLKSPVCLGREDGGYFGLFWRGAPSWGFGHVSPLQDSMMGSKSPSLTFTKVHGGKEVAALRFSDHPENPRFPTQWFERHAEQAIVTASLAYSEPWVIAPEDSLRLSYSITLTDLTG